MISRISFAGALISWLTFMSFLSPLQAQGVATARISGTLTDDSGAVLVGAAVQAKNVEMGSSRSTVTDSGGRFAIADLLIGSYDVRASSPGFDPVVRSGIVFTIGADLVIDFTLKIGQARQDVIVNAQVSRVETQTGAVSSLVSSQQLHDLPFKREESRAVDFVGARGLTGAFLVGTNRYRNTDQSNLRQSEQLLDFRIPPCRHSVPAR
jgi:hypothetical protein